MMSKLHLYPAIFILITFCLSCRPAPREIIYDLRGQVISIYSVKNEITIKHEEIPGFMPAMTMPFKVKDVTLLEKRKPGDFIEAKLVVTEKEAYLTAIVKIGFEELINTESLQNSINGITQLRKGDLLPDTAFIDQDNRVQHFNAFRGKQLILTFIYTRCPLPNFCPLMDLHFQSLQKTILESSDLKATTRLFSISFDPEFDTPEILKQYGDVLKADYEIWSFLTGEGKSIINFAEHFGITVVQNESVPDEIAHSLRTVIVDASGKLVKILRGNEWTPDEILQELTQLSSRD
jgi:protein SCO1/2